MPHSLPDVIPRPRLMPFPVPNHAGTTVANHAGTTQDAMDVSEESDERIDEALQSHEATDVSEESDDEALQSHEATDVCDESDVLKIPSAEEIFGKLAPKKSGPEYDAAWRDLLAFLTSDLGK